jgi:hypothetical protein
MEHEPQQEPGQEPAAARPDAARPDAARPVAARRNFLKAAPLGALAVVAGRAPAAETASVAAPPVAAAPRGYHETEHIRRYYQTAAYW